MSTQPNETSFELNLKLSPAEAIKQVIEQSDEMNVKTDKEAWMSLVRGYPGSKKYLYALNGDTIFIQRRPELGRPHYGVRIKIEPTSYGSKLAGVLALTSWLKIFCVLWFGIIILVLIIAAVSFPREIAAGEKHTSDLLWLSVPIGMLMVGYLFNVLGRKSASKKEMIEVQEWLGDLYADSKVDVGTRREA